MRAKQDYIMREVGDEKILIPVGDAADKVNGVIVLNEVAAEIWTLLSSEQSIDSIVEQLLELFDVDKAILRNDV